MRSIFFLSVLLLTSGLFGQDRPNVLFIAVDDLRPELGCYGREHIHSPNIDELSSSGVLFERAYCMVPTCGASRASLMTSIRPARDRFVTHLAWAEKEAPQALPLHKHLKQNGYTTISLGKVFHHREDHVDGWSEKPWHSRASSYQDAKATQVAIRANRQSWPKKSKHRGPAFESYAADDSLYRDGDCARQAVEYLEKFAAEDRDQPFFLAVGFLKPHLPFNAPEKYWDLYDRSEIKLPANYQIPTDVPKDAPHGSGELRAYAGIPHKGPVDRETALSLIHGYYACVSFADAQIGKLMRSLEETGLAEDTVVVLWGDHGWQLGEHGMWNKHSCFETSLHTPLIIKAPHRADVQAGSRVAGLSEFIDIYPTICDLVDVDIPGHVEGKSLIAAMKDPNAATKSFAISRFGNGDSIRGDQFRYSEYRTKKGAFSGAMLFDHEQDPSEDQNLYKGASEPATGLARELRKGMGRPYARN